MKKLSFIAALGFGTVFTASAWADCISGDCASLGYSTADVPDCENYIYCPFDINYKICAHVAPKLLDSCPAGKTCVEKYRVSGDEAACDVGYKKTVAECGTVAFGSYKLGAAQASNAACKKCEITCNTGYTLSNGVCSKPKTCDDRLREFNCKRYNDGASISGNLSNLKICLFGTVTQAIGYNNSLTLDNTTFYDAGKQFPECEAEMKGRAKLVTKGSVTMKGDSSFFCDVSIDYVSFRPGGTWSADFYGNTDIRVDYSAFWGGILFMSFYGNEGEEKTTNRVFVQCEQTSTYNQWDDIYCGVEIHALNADVSYRGVTMSGFCSSNSYSGSYCKGEPRIMCHEYYNATCKEDLNYYNW